MEAYCLKCKQKREIQNPIAEYTANGRPITKGTCPVCNSKLSLIGKTAAHEGLEKPQITKAAKKANSKKVVAKTHSKGPNSKNLNGSKNGTNTTRGIGQKLVIVESPAKARTVGNFLGKGYIVKASIGHVRDLKKSTLSVDVENGFTPEYRVPNEKRALVKELSTLAKNSDEVYLATDPDREGEAIAWHLLEAADIDPKKTERVVFHEITKPAIAEAFKNPRDINMDLVDAQQARRILDRLVGYNLSPLLWNKVQRRLSAGRVQSVAVKLIVDREREIENFVPREYWTITVELQPQDIKGTFLSRLVKIDQADPELNNEEQVQFHLNHLQSADYVIDAIKKNVRHRKPSAPFTTSTLQQEASKRLGLTANRTMALAQQLYEGIDLGSEGSAGLITYMRTDSTNISEIAQNEARKYIQQTYGSGFVPKTAPVYKTKTQRAQEAHEAIRPTTVNRTPEQMKPYLNRDLFRLYQLIWQRFVSSQMEDALYDTLTIDVSAKDAHDYLFRSSGSKLKFQGFLAVYEESKDEDLVIDEMENTKFPEGLAVGQKLQCIHTIPEQHFTQPPARYTEATLVKTLEENGIGRPSTYASILSTIQTRGYVVREAKRLYPTETGILVNDLLVNSFPNVVNIGFTSQMEGELDDVAGGEKKWQTVVGDFYKEFEPALNQARKELPKAQLEPEKVGRKCPQCGKDLVIRNGKYGKFISCSGFPQCRYTEQIVEKLDVPCPKCGKELIVRRSKNGRIFYGCSGYPECQFTSWKKPVKQKCPNCGGMLVEMNRDTLQCIECKTKVENKDSE